MTYEGPAGLELVATGAKRTPAKVTIEYELYRGGKVLGAIVATTAPTGIDDAVRRILDIDADARDAAIPEQEKKAIRAWARTVLTPAAMQGICAAFEARRSADTAADDRPTMFDIALRHAREDIGLAFVAGERIWSESLGESLTRDRFVKTMDRDLLDRIRGTRDYPKPTANDPTKPHHHLQRVLQVVWTELRKTLPDEPGAGLGPDSRAASSFRGKLAKVLSTPEAWRKVKSADGDPRTERLSVASAIRQDLERAPAPRRSGGRARWIRPLLGVDVWYRAELDDAGDLVLHLGLRVDAIRGQIRGQTLEVRGQREFAALLDGYGCTAAGVPGTVREGRRQLTLVVLNAEFSERLVFGDDIDAESLRRPRGQVNGDDASGRGRGRRTR